MSSIEKDPRFSRVLTDPRFLPMPTYEKKVKIDKRFNALFTSKDFGHRTLLDKRGRPIHDVSKRGKHVMEQFYQLSSDDSASDSDNEKDEVSGDDGQSTKSSRVKSNASSAAKPKVKKSKDVDVSEAELGKDKAKNKIKEPSVLKSKKDKVQSTRHKQHEERSDDDSYGYEKKTSQKRKNNLDKGRDDLDDEPRMKKTKKGQKFKTKQNSSENDKDTEDEEKDESESSESDDSSDEEEILEYTADFDLQDTMVEHKWNELHSDAPPVLESTRRLAVCNMDWDFVKAQDLFVLFKSFAGEGGAVHSVTIYPSEFGKERMAEEAVLGPREMREMLKDGEKGQPETKKKKKGKQRILDQQKTKRMEKQMVKAEHEVLREYQLNRMRYYYAVVDCNCVEAADNIYKECDGQEYQLSSVKLDLRFIPNDMTFDDEPKESFTEEQGLVDYTPKLFNSTALSQAKVDVTWDETEFDRLHKKMVHLQHKELENIVEENRYADIIAPPESDSDSDDASRPQWLKSVLAEGDEEDEEISEETKISMYRKVLMDKLVEEEEKEKRENEVDKELQWQPGLKSHVANKLNKKNDKTEGTIVDEYLEKKREKKKKKREHKKASLAKTVDDDDENDDVPGIIDNQLKEMMESEGVDLDSMKEKRKKRLEEEEEEEDNTEDEEREKAELELLLMGDGDEKKIRKPEKVEGKLSRRQKKKKSLLAKEQKKKEAEDLTIDVDDPRFGAIFTSHHFHIDPNAPEFNKTHNMMKLVDEQIKRKPKVKREKSVGIGNEDEGEDSRTVSKNLLESLKRKMKK